MKTIKLIHPSRGRPEQALEASKLWRAKARNPERIVEILSLDIDDPELENYKTFDSYVIEERNDNRGMVSATNRGFKHLKENEIVITMYDDFEPPQDYDYYLELLLKDHSGHSVFVDCDNPHIQTIQIACSNLFLKWGYILYPEYYSMYSDNDYTIQASTEGVAIDARFALHFAHYHPLITGQGELDETYKRSNSQENYESGEKIFEKRKQEILKQAQQNRQKELLIKE